MTRASDATGGAGASIIDIELFRRDRSIEAATISPAIACAVAASDGQASAPFSRRLGKGDKVLDKITREVGMIIRVPDDQRSRFIVSFPWGRRAVFASQVDVWTDYTPALPCDVEPDLFGPDVSSAVQP